MSNQYLIFNKIIILFLFSFNIYSADYIITTSGTYVLSDDLLSTNADSNGAIRIRSSFVTLDLNGRFIMQNNSTANANGIVIDSNLTDIIIKNGTIVNFTRAGVTVNSGCSVITLQDLKIENCQQLAIELLGASNNRISKCFVDNCKMFGCGSASSSNHLLNINQCTSTKVSNCIISDSIMPNNQNGANAIRVLWVQSSTNCEFNNITIQNMVFSTGTAPALKILMRIDTSSNCRFRKFILRNNRFTGVGADLYGMVFTTRTNSNMLFEDFLSILNQTNLTNITFAGRSNATLNSSVTNFVFSGCKVIGDISTGGACRGWNFDTVQGGARGLYKNCMALGLRAASNNDATGMIPSYNLSQVINCSSLHNSTSGSGQAVGINISASDMLIQNCDAFNNTNSGSDPDSIGILTSGGSNIVFCQNVAVRNGSTANTNNYSGVGAGSITSTTSATVATPTSPWSNLSIAS